MPQPLISIITPSLNRAQFIREAIQSVIDQNYPNFEHIIVDAASTDGTMEILREYPHLRVVSEPDRGMYDAINKGIRMARGEIVGLLNTDDLYAPRAFESVVRGFDRNPDALALVGGIEVFRGDQQPYEPIGTYDAIAPSELWHRLIQGHPVTNAWFYKRSVFDVAGYFDTSYRFSADRYFLIHAALDAGIHPAPIREILYRYRQHRNSATITSMDSRQKEYGLLRIKILWEDIDALEKFLCRPRLPDEIRSLMKREHGERCYRLAVTAAWHSRYRDAIRAIGHGFRRNPFWMFVFVDMALVRLKGEFSHHA